MLKTSYAALLAVLAIVAVRPTKAEVDGGGQAGAFLQVSWSARAAAMGGAFVAVADDAQTGLMNPAGTIELKKRHFAASYRKMTLDRRMGFVSYAQTLQEGDAGIGISWINLGVGDIEERNINGELIGDIRYYENLLALSFGKRFAKVILLGVNVKYDQSNLAGISVNGLGFDLGFLWVKNKPLKLGLAVQNVGLGHKWTTGDYWKNRGEIGSNTTDDFPILVRVGGSYKFYQDRLLAALDLEKKENQQFLIHAGGEGWINQHLALRGGYNRDVVTLGFGLKYQWQKATVGVNYAFNAGSSSLDPDNLVSIAVEF
jgi:long-subunit fatty acid transport protein